MRVLRNCALMLLAVVGAFAAKRNVLADWTSYDYNQVWVYSGECSAYACSQSNWIWNTCNEECQAFWGSTVHVHHGQCNNDTGNQHCYASCSCTIN
jgi:hypothetical protein